MRELKPHELRRLEEEWKKLRLQIDNHTEETSNETAEEKRARIARLLEPKHFEEFCQYYFPHIVKVKMPAFHKRVAQKMRTDPHAFIVRIWARKLSKTTLLKMIAINMVCAKDLNFALLASSSFDKAAGLLMHIQTEFEANARLKADFGFQPAGGSWTHGDFTIANGPRFTAYGKGQNPRGELHNGMPPDVLFIDDIDDDEECRNPTRLDNSEDWLLQALYPAGDMNRLRLLAINNEIAKDTLIRRLAKVDGADVEVINMLDKKGNSAWPEKYTVANIMRMIRRMGYYRSQTEYFNNPIKKGKIFRIEWIHWGKMLPLNQYEYILAYYDPSWKTSGDYKAIAVLGRKGRKYHVLKMFCRQCSQMEVVRWAYDEYEKIKDKGVAVEWRVEANLMQDTHAEDFYNEGVSRGGDQLPLGMDYRSKPNKLARLTAMTVWFERGEVIFNEALKDNNDMKAALDQLLAVGEGSRAHDDAPDALEGALHLLNIRVRPEGHRSHVITPRTTQGF